MKELNEEMEKINIRIGELMGQQMINNEKYGEELAKEMNEYIQELINEKEQQLDILKNAEMILLGIDYKKYSKKGNKEEE